MRIKVKKRNTLIEEFFTFSIQCVKILTSICKPPIMGNTIAAVFLPIAYPCQRISSAVLDDFFARPPPVSSAGVSIRFHALAVCVAI